MLTLPSLLEHPEVRVVAAFDLRRDAVTQFADEFGVASHDRLEDFLADPNIDAVYIATPHELHAQQSIAALRAGKHVLVERPMATSMQDCAAMVSAASAARRTLMVGPSHGFDGPVSGAAQLIASGRYGAVRMVTAFNFTDFMYRPRRAAELDDAMGGGVVFSQAAHQIDVIRRLVDRPVETVRAAAGNWDEARPSNGAYSAWMIFSGGAVATLTYSGYAHYDSDELMGWVSELGQPKDANRYGEARRVLSSLPPNGENQAKLTRTYGSGGGSLPPAPAHNEHFGFVLGSCERADLKLRPDGIEIYADDAHEFLPIPLLRQARLGVIDAFVAAVRGSAEAAEHGVWGMQTVACCKAIIESSRRAVEIDIQQLIENEMETLSK